MYNMYILFMGGLNSGKTRKRKKITVTFTAYPEDIARWCAQAAAQKWSLSQWIYTQMIASEAVRETRSAVRK
jgi:hypothetical protein